MTPSGSCIGRKTDRNYFFALFPPQAKRVGERSESGVSKLAAMHLR